MYNSPKKHNTNAINNHDFKPWFFDNPVISIRLLPMASRLVVEYTFSINRA